jgi:hypothetical protein
VKFVSPFVSPRLSSHPCETERPSSPSLKLKPCPSGHQNVVLDNGRDSADLFFEKENFCAMDNPLAPTLETKKDTTYEHESFTFETPQDSCSLLESPEFVSFMTTCYYEDPNHFRRMDVDAFVYQKYCKSHSSTVALTLQLER